MSRAIMSNPTSQTTKKYKRERNPEEDEREGEVVRGERRKYQGQGVWSESECVFGSVRVRNVCLLRSEPERDMQNSYHHPQGRIQD